MFKSTLFTKLSLVIVTALIFTNGLLLLLTSYFFKNTFIKSYTETRTQIINEVAHDLEKLNESMLLTIQQYKYSKPLQDYMTKDYTELELFNLHYAIEQSLNPVHQLPLSSMFYTVVLGNNGKTYVPSDQILALTTSELRDLPITHLSQSNPSKIFYTYQDTPLSLRHTTATGDIIMATQLIDPYTHQNFGTLYLVVEESIFNNLYLGFTSHDTHFLLVNQIGDVLSSNMPSYVGTSQLPLLTSATKGMHDFTSCHVVNIAHSQSLLLTTYLPIYDMYLINIVDYNLIFEDYHKLKPWLLIICFIVTLLAITLVFFITYRLIKPLKSFICHLQQSPSGHPIKFDKPCLGYEIKYLQSTYNEMIDALNLYIEQLINEQKQRRKAELAALQMQINPHFLYNTLATIKYLCWQNNTQGIATTINALISLLENTIYKESEFISLTMEIENLKNYVTINHMRYGESIQVFYFFPSECASFLVPKLLLQPFVENAFFHAFQTKKQGSIQVIISMYDSLLDLQIIDNGDGMQEAIDSPIPPDFSNKQHFTGIGIRNIHERLRLIYGEAYGVSITSTPKIGTEIHIKLPASYTPPIL